MDEKKVREAIEIIKSNYPTSGYYMLCEALDTAIEALEKQLPKRVDFEEDVTEGMCVQCPSCGNFLGYQGDCLDENYQSDYCQSCGQKLDWSEN